jgi:hypothetical protein
MWRILKGFGTMIMLARSIRFRGRFVRIVYKRHSGVGITSFGHNLKKQKPRVITGFSNERTITAKSHKY